MIYRTILIFGGAFNPPTLAHEAIIRQWSSMPGFDEIWLTPSGSRTDKHISITSQQQLVPLGILR
ncbi:MAG: hypothetical protein WBO35_00560 [Candidatus Saccharimonadales bacterium]